ncbi:MAG: hypothetical protein WDN08_16215 [Rhizomicrobium sp.]
MTSLLSQSISPRSFSSAATRSITGCFVRIVAHRVSTSTSSP